MRFIRTVPHRRRITSELRRLGLDGLADLIKTLTIPTLTDWRWTTLWDATKEYLTVWCSLGPVFDRTWFAHCREKDATMFADALVSQIFYIQLKTVDCFCGWLTPHLQLDWRLPMLPCWRKQWVLYERTPTRRSRGIRGTSAWGWDW